MRIERKNKLRVKEGRESICEFKDVRNGCGVRGIM
jgi:hypothetical protein